jgi:hypothetical protein
MTWFKIEDYESGKEAQNLSIILNQDLFPELQHEVTIKFGLNETKAFVKRVNNLPTSKQYLQKHVTILYISPSLQKSLTIPMSQLYKAKVANGFLELGPVIGLLLGEQQYYYHHKFMREYSAVMERGKNIGGLVVAFKSCSIDWETNSIYGLYYNMKTQNWQYSKLPIPTTIFRRGFSQKDSAIIERLSKLTGGNLFNSRKYSKLELYEELKENVGLKMYLPETEKLSKDMLLQFVEKYPKVVIKPDNLSRGRGIFIIQKMDEMFCFYEYIDDAIPIRFTLDWEHLMDCILQKRIFEQGYLIQQFIDLAQIDEAPWDIRIVMQKKTRKLWQCSGIECRLAAPEGFITNISQGGRPLTLLEALKMTFGNSVNTEKIQEDLIDLSKKFCSIIDEGNDHFGEFGLDFGLDKDLNYWFIEANVRPSFQGFKELDADKYLDICSIPLFYAATLSGFDEITLEE